MKDTMTIAVGARGIATGSDRGNRLVRLVVVALMAALVLPVLMMAFASPASAEEDPADDYSLYKLSSNASTYFAEKSSPEESNKGMPANKWESVTTSPATGGSLLGYADPEFSLGNVVGWFFAEVSGSSQTVGYDTFSSMGGKDDEARVQSYSGVLDYAHFGAANKDLGLDSMTSNVMVDIMNWVGGGIMWLLYALSLFTTMLFFGFVQLLKILNPFRWFYAAVKGVAASTDEDGNLVNDDPGHTGNQGELADGMTGGQSAPTALAGVSEFVDNWYGLIVSISWEVLVPLFIGFLLIGLVLFKKMDRGSAIKKLIVRVVFIGIGLPLMGSLYTGVLDQFDDSLKGEHAGPTRVVLSTYVDFESWMMNQRLAIPEGSTIGWAGDQASSESMMSVRSTALAINKSSHGNTFDGISDAGSKAGNDDWGATDAWSDSMAGMDNTKVEDDNAVFAVFGMLQRAMGNEEVVASDFESGIKTSITKMNDDVADDAEKRSWFVGDKGYGDPKQFGEQDDPPPNEHPVISVGGMGSDTGLTSSNPGKNTTNFTTTGVDSACGFAVKDENGNVPCNLSPLAGYNYLNTSFGAESLTLFSSNNASAGMMRENHMSVSQVGTGPAKFMYWANAATVLGSLVLIAIWYAFGMLFGALKRTFSLVAAVPFATLGAMAAISKVIVYSVALVLEVLVTIFIYQFVSELLISIPDIIAGPVSSLVGDDDSIFSGALLGGITVVILTLISTILVIVITFAMLRVRKVVLQAMDEVFTKLVDKFLDTNTAPKPDKGGMMPALAGGLGAGAGMAAGQKLSSAAQNKFGGGGGGGKKPSPTNSNRPGTNSQSTNAGGTNGKKELAGGKGQKALEAGKPGESKFGEAEGPSAGGTDGKGGDTSDVKALPAGSGGEGDDGRNGRDGESEKGTALALKNGEGGSSISAKEKAEGLSNQGGLSNLGYAGGTNGKGPDGKGIGSDAGGKDGQSAGGKNSAGKSLGSSSRSAAAGGKVSEEAVAGGGSRFGVNGADQSGKPGSQSGQQGAPGKEGQNGPATQSGRQSQGNRAGRTGEGQTSFGTGGTGGVNGARGTGQSEQPSQQTQQGQAKQGSGRKGLTQATGGALPKAGASNSVAGIAAAAKPGQRQPQRPGQSSNSVSSQTQGAAQQSKPGQGRQQGGARFVAGTTGSATAVPSGQNGQPRAARGPGQQQAPTQRQSTTAIPQRQGGSPAQPRQQGSIQRQAPAQRQAPTPQRQQVPSQPRQVSQPTPKAPVQPKPKAPVTPKAPTQPSQTQSAPTQPRRSSQSETPGPVATGDASSKSKMSPKSDKPKH